jgi:hypothetical protein
LVIPQKATRLRTQFARRELVAYEFNQPAEMDMKPVAILGALVLGMMAFPGSGEARTYAWCAYYTWHGNNCGFSTLSQCRAAVSGVGGYCQPNPRVAYDHRKRYR